MARAVAAVVTLMMFGCTEDSESSGFNIKPKGPCKQYSKSSPETFEEVVELINSLPKPVTIECFVAAIKRPIRIFASHSSFSAQPAVGARSPRTFIINNNLTLSVVPAGIGRDHMEMSLMVENGYSLKGEIQFPIDDILEISAPYLSVREGGGTTCRGCHSGEHIANHIDFAEAFVSSAYRPRTSSEVNLDWLRVESDICDESEEAHRCSVLRGIFGYGEVERGDFPQSMPSF